MNKLINSKLHLLLAIISIGLLNAQKTSNLLFESSFDNIIVDKTVEWNHHLSGTDSETNFMFPNDLPGDYTEHFFNYVVGDLENYFEYANAEITNTIGYDGNQTNALYIEFIKDDPDFISYSRVQYVMYGDNSSNDPVQRMNQGYVKYKIKTHLDHNDLESDWRIPIEWKDMDDDGFRVGLYIYDTNTPSPYWVVKGQYMINGELGDDVWEFQNYTIPVIEDEWFDLEVYWYGHPDPNLGKLKVAINDQVLFDVTNQTKDPNQPNKMFYFMPFKVYGAVGYSWITDFEYRNIPPSNSILFDIQLSTEDKIDSSNFIIYPNPVNDFFSFSTDVLDLKYQIITVTGKIVNEGIISKQKIDVSLLKNGVYFVKVTDQISNIKYYLKLIKSN
ncbi:MAG: T9SS type A sorting domain-containing protein [Flavobacteriaceae bacterium]